MTIYENWIRRAYDAQGNTIKKYWETHMPLEQKIYEDMLSTKNTEISGTVAEIAARYDVLIESAVGFLDGISGALDIELEMNELTEETQIDAKVDFETLYKKMVEYNAKHLLALPQWDNVFSAEEREKMYKEQKSATTVVREGEKIGRNDPCPCSSGKKYKKCCGGAA
ncbi:MAG: SEC-C metal-binding domain-containing protein [Defluviitaleaceae bacterium]|nr:SEC-C metal-binding domain-containing protein [Defluviitaleaceae bacterium]